MELEKGDNMEFIFEFELSTSLLVFPAISLLMLAYTNRFVVLADLIRELYKSHKLDPKQENIDQIENLQYRMDIIRKMQLTGALSFISAAISTLFSLLASHTQFATTGNEATSFAFFAFVVSIILLIVSLVYLIRELAISIDALKIQLYHLQD